MSLKNVGAITLFVEDPRGLERRAVSLDNGPVDRPWGVRTATFADPDGHVWEAAQALSQPSSGAATE